MCAFIRRMISTISITTKKPFAWDKRFFVFNIDVRIDFFNANSNIELHSID